MPKFKKNTSPAMKRSGFKMGGYSYPGVSPVRQGDQPYTKKKSEEVERKKGLLEDRIDLTVQNKKKIAELKAKVITGKITKEAYDKAVQEIKGYVNPK